MRHTLASILGGLRAQPRGDQPPRPIGFGRGRRTSQILIVYCTHADGKPVPESVPQWAPGAGYDDFWLSLLSGFGVSGEEAGFSFAWRPWRQGDAADTILRELPAYDGLIIVSPRETHKPLLAALEQAGMPVALVMGRHPNPRYLSVTCDNAGGVAQTIRHLHRLGHSSIGYLGDSPTTFAFQERVQAHYAAMAEEGLTVDPDWVVTCERTQLPAMAEDLLRRPGHPTAWLCFDDGVAALLIEQAVALGMRVPEDVAVVGFDDVELALQTLPHLTTVRLPTADMAGLAMHLLACCILGVEPAGGAWQAELSVTLVIRESCGAAPAAESPEGGEGRRPQTVRQELEWRTRQLAAMNQEMKELLHAASHDLRSPLITVQGFATALRRKYADVLDPRGCHYLHRIGESVEHMGKLIDSLLSLSRAHNWPLEMGRVSVRNVVDRVLNDLDSAIVEKRARLRVRGRLPVVLADDTALYRVFLNLLSNALRYLGTQPAPLIAIYCRNTPEEYEFTVQDNGIGIAAEHHEEIFQPFRRLGTVRTEGVGIGLAIVKRIILRHGGRIWVDSQPGNGAAFRFTLPRRDSAFDTEPGPAS